MAFLSALHCHDVLPSTMDEARRLASLENADEGTVVQAATQTAGRGRFGNQWVSPQGNLYMTVLLRPEKPMRVCAQLSFVVAIALADTLAAFGVPAALTKLKWPNDVLVDGRKIAGILLEMESGQGGLPAFLLAGIGVNLAHAPDGAHCVHAFAPETTLEGFRGALVENIGAAYAGWLVNGFEKTRERWLLQAYGMGAPAVARMADRKVEGVFSGVDGEGNIRLETAGGVPVVISGADVQFKPL